MIGFIGGGNMSTAIGTAIIKKGIVKPEDVWVSGPRLHNIQHWKDMGANTTTSNGKVCIKADIIFLGVKPDMLGQAIEDCLKEDLSSISKQEKCFVSMLAGKTIADLSKQVSRVTPSATVVRILPNTPMMLGVGVCLLCPGPNVKEENLNKIKEICSTCGIYEEVAEKLIDGMGSLSGCSPAYMYLIIEALADGGVKVGGTRQMAIKLAAQAMIGAATMVLQSGKHPAQLRDEICSPGGSTIAGVATLESGGVRSALIQALEASTNRSKELGKM